MSASDQPRAELVARLAQDLEHASTPRLQLLIMMIVAGGAGFLASVLLLWSPAQVFELMAPRYAAAALCGYLVFIALVRVWIALHRPAGDGPDLDALDALDVFARGFEPSAPSAGPAPGLFSGGRGGGAGASSRWSGSMSSEGRIGSSGFGLDLEDGIWLIVAAACALAGVAAIGYVVYMAPVLLAEVALDAAVISVLYRRLRRDEEGHWLVTVVRHTWAPALVLVVFAFIAGYALQQIAPEARSIGAVLQSFD